MQTLSKEQIQKNVAANFKHIRKGLKLTQVQMGEALNIKAKNLGAIEEGRAITPYYVYSLSMFTGISTDTILTTQLSIQNQ